MNTGFLSRRAFVATGICVLTVGCGMEQVLAADAGFVKSLKGLAVASAGGVERALAPGGAVRLGDIVTTNKDSRISLALGATTLVHLGPATRLAIESHLIDAGGDFELTDGSLLLEHSADLPQKAQIKSPYGLIAVRGTRVFASQSASGFSVFVADGLVDVTGAGKTVSLKAGRGTDIAAAGLPPKPSAAWKQSRIRAAEAVIFSGRRRF